MKTFNKLVHLIEQELGQEDNKNLFLKNFYYNVDTLFNATNSYFLTGLKEIVQMLDKNPKFYHRFFQHYRGEVVNGVRYRRVLRAILILNLSCSRSGFSNNELCKRLQERFRYEDENYFYNYFFQSEQGVKDFEKLFEDKIPYDSKKIKEVFYNNYAVKENKDTQNRELQFRFIVDFLSINAVNKLDNLNGGPSQAKIQTTTAASFEPKTTETTYTPSIKSTEFKPVQSTY